MRLANTFRKRLTYANVVATIGLFIALGGGAYAVTSKAPKDSVNSRAIVDGTVKSADVKDNSLTGADINQSTLSGGGGGGGPPSGPAGGDLAGNYPKPQLAPGAVGENALADSAVGTSALKSGAVTSTKLGEIIAVGGDAVYGGPGSSGQAEATCPRGTTLISGGETTTGFGDAAIEDNGATQGGAWYAQAVSITNQTGNLHVFALCLK